MRNKHTVIVILEAKSDKEQSLKELLLSVVESSRAEKTCIEYKLHQDINNPSQFIFYEIWENASAHQQQFSKPYIISLGNQIESLLAKPYQVFLAKEL